MDRPDRKEQLKVFTNLFEAFKKIDLDWKSKYAGFERILSDSKKVDHWLITGISRDALKEIAKHGFPKTNKGVVRGHITDRKDRAEYLFTHNFKSTEEAFDYFMEHDKVMLVTKNENGRGKGPEDWSEWYPIPPETFPYSCGHSAKYTDKALAFLRKLAKKKGIGDDQCANT